MRLWRKRIVVLPRSTYTELVIQDGNLTALAKGVMRERVPDIEPHGFHERTYQRGAQTLRTGRCMVCEQLADHPLHGSVEHAQG